MKITQLPKSCPNCDKPFSTVLRPKRTPQKKAVMLFLAGIVLTIVWALVLFGLATLSPVVVVPRHPIGFVIAVIILFAPGLAIGSWAMKLPKVVRLNCSKCQWSDRYVVDNRG